ncbi:UNVERIFIED_ORG: hypothetical protein ABID57_000660 [Arthrobacter sp. UYEF1]
MEDREREWLEYLVRLAKELADDNKRLFEDFGPLLGPVNAQLEALMVRRGIEILKQYADGK